MRDYYIKIKQKESEIEFSTSDKTEFNQKIRMLMQIAGAFEEESNVSEKNNDIKDSKDQVVTNIENVNPDIPVNNSYTDTEFTTKNEEQPNVENKKVYSEKNYFDKLLEENIKNPKEQISSNAGADREFELLYKKNTFENDMERLVFTAGYLLEYEGKSIFTLKDINRKLFPIIEQPIVHTHINYARVSGYIRIVPNYTDIKTPTQYIITDEGEQFYHAFSARRK